VQEVVAIARSARSCEAGAAVIVVTSCGGDAFQRLGSRAVGIRDGDPIGEAGGRCAQAPLDEETLQRDPDLCWR
jgi:hypothetical protein